MRYSELWEAKLKFSPVQVWTADDVYNAYRLRPNRDVFQRIKYLHTSEYHRETHLVILYGKKIVAMAGLQINPYNTNMLWIKHISVDENYRQNGLATQLIKGCFEYAQTHNLILKNSSYSEMGEQYIHKIFDRVKELYPNVKFEEQDKY